MQVFKTFFKIVLKNFSSAIMYIVIFTALAVILAKSNNANPTQTFSAERIDIAVFDRDNSTLSKSLYELLDETQNIIETPDDEEQWQDALFYETVNYIVVIEKGFEAGLIAGECEDIVTSYKNPSSTSSYIVSTQIESYLQYLRFYMNSGNTMDEAIAAAKETATTTVESAYLDDNIATEVSPASAFYTFVPYIMVCVLINALAPMLMIWNRSEIRSRTTISSLRQRKISGGLIGATFCATLVIYIIFSIVAMLLDRELFLSMKGLYFEINMFACALTTLAITYLIAQLSKKQTTLAIWSNVYGLGSSFLCGIFVSRSLLTDEVISASRVLPSYWYMNVVEELGTFNNHILSSNAWFSILIQLVFAVAIYGIALVVIRAKRQKY